jgi:hypothetical protein
VSENLSKLYTTQFTANLQLNLQQQGSELRGLTMEGSHVGKQASPVQYMKPIRSRQPAGRFSPIERVDTDFQRRWVFPQERDIPQLIDNFDLVQTITDPKSQYVTNASYACGRDWDDALIAAAFATAYTGQDASALSSETFSTSSYGISEKFGNGSTAIGMTVEKFIEANRIFRHAHVDMKGDPRTLVLGSQQEADLMGLTEVVSTEFNSRPVMAEDGTVTRFMGYNIRYSERLGFGTGIGSSSNCRKTIAFVRSGLYLGMWKDMTNDVDVRKDLTGHPWQLYTLHYFGAARLEPGRLLRIDCGNDSAGADNI